jgi:hypothetical protein
VVAAACYLVGLVGHELLCRRKSAQPVTPAGADERAVLARGLDDTAEVSSRSGNRSA